MNGGGVSPGVLGVSEEGGEAREEVREEKGFIGGGEGGIWDEEGMGAARVLLSHSSS